MCLFSFFACAGLVDSLGSLGGKNGEFFFLRGLKDHTSGTLDIEGMV
jgi:hypothetical protein